MNKLTRVAQALSDETRLRILNIVSEHECCVCEVMQALDISQTRASRNLKILYDAGFLDMRTDGLYTLYSLRKNNDGSFYSKLLDAVYQELATDPVARKDSSRLAKAKRVEPGNIPQEEVLGRASPKKRGGCRCN
jgi:ArsR family transcriptional regulator